MSDNKARLQLRLDPDVHDRLKALAEEAGVSANKLLEGLARWAMDHGHAGEPQIDDSDGVCYGVRQTPGVIWFGFEAQRYTEQDEEGTHEHEVPPLVQFWLDFREHYGVPPRRHLSGGGHSRLQAGEELA